MVSSGLRIGTPALATRGFGEAEFEEVIARALASEPTVELLAELRRRVSNLAAKHPLYPEL